MEFIFTLRKTGLAKTGVAGPFLPALLKNIVTDSNHVVGNSKLSPGLLCSKFYLLCFWVVLKNNAYYAQYYAHKYWIMPQFIYNFIILMTRLA